MTNSPHKAFPLRRAVTALLAGSIAIAMALAFLVPPVSAQSKAKPQPSKVAEYSLAPMLRKVIPGIVSVRVTGERQRPTVIGVSGGGAKDVNPMAVEPFRSGGSGVVIDAAKGLIITNNHVIADALQIEVGLYDGRAAPARLIGTDVGTDVAVLKVDLKGLTVVPFGNSDTLRVGDTIVAVGNPFGLEHSASKGIVSAMARSDIGYEIFEDFIQVDAAINPGNSGGALLDVDGRLVGINTATASGKSRAQGISFAIPINMARAIADELVRSGTFRRGILGFHTADLTPEMARQKAMSSNSRGAAVTHIVPDSPAEKAGVKPGDVVVAVSGRPIRGNTDYVARVATTPVGSVLKISLVSNGKERELTLAVADVRCDPPAESAPMGVRSLAAMQFGVMLPGFEAFGKVQGVRVLTIDGARAAATGLAADDVITGIEGTTTRTPQDLFELASTKSGRYRLDVYRSGKPLWIWIDGNV